MSYIGKKIIKTPSSVSVIKDNSLLTVKGPLGELSLTLPLEIIVSIHNDEVSVQYNPISNIKKVNKRNMPLWGTYRSLINNMVLGVSRGYNVKLELVGVGYRASLKNNVLTLKLGYSHDVIYEVPQGIQLKCMKPTLIEIGGINKQLVNQVAAEIRFFRKPDAYKGKGIRYFGEVIKLKEGKKK